MKITFVFWSLEVGGVEKMMARMMSHYADRHEVTFVHIRPPIDVPQVAVNSRVEVVHLGARNIVSTVWRLARFLSTNPPDLVFTAMPTTNAAAIAARLLSVKKFKLVVSERSDPSGELKAMKSWRYRFAVRFAAYLYPLADAVVCVSNGLANELMAKTGLRHPKLRVIYNPVVARDVTQAAAEPVHDWLLRRDVPVLVAATKAKNQKKPSTIANPQAKHGSSKYSQQPSRPIVKTTASNSIEFSKVGLSRHFRPAICRRPADYSGGTLRKAIARRFQALMAMTA